MARYTAGSVAADAFRKCVGGLGWLGAFLVIYALVAEVSGSYWGWLETWGPPASIFITIVGTLLTAMSVYIYQERSSPPEVFSLWLSAPFVCAACIIACGVLVTKGTLPVMATNGLAILGLSGGLFRLQMNPGIIDGTGGTDVAAN